MLVEALADLDEQENVGEGTGFFVDMIRMLSFSETESFWPEELLPVLDYFTNNNLILTGDDKIKRVARVDLLPLMSVSVRSKNPDRTRVSKLVHLINKLNKQKRRLFPVKGKNIKVDGNYLIGNASKRTFFSLDDTRMILEYLGVCNLNWNVIHSSYASSSIEEIVQKMEQTSFLQLAIEWLREWLMQVIKFPYGPAGPATVLVSDLLQIFKDETDIQKITVFVTDLLETWKQEERKGVFKLGGEKMRNIYITLNLFYEFLEAINKSETLQLSKPPEVLSRPFVKSTLVQL